MPFTKPIINKEVDNVKKLIESLEAPGGDKVILHKVKSNIKNSAKRKAKGRKLVVTKTKKTKPVVTESKLTGSELCLVHPELMDSKYNQVFQLEKEGKVVIREDLGKVFKVQFPSGELVELGLSVNGSGYRQFEIDGVQRILVHRLLAQKVNGPCPKGLIVHHKTILKRTIAELI